MNKERILKDINEKDNNVVNFDEIRRNIQTGGSGIDENWLKALPKGTVFLCKKRNTPKDNLVCELFAVIEHKVLHTNLMQKIPNGQQADFWFNSLEFSRAFILGEVIAEITFDYSAEQAAFEEQQETLETTDGTSDRTV